MADLLHPRQVDGRVLSQKRQASDDWEVQLLTNLPPQEVGHQVEDGDVLLVEAFLDGEMIGPEVLPHALAQLGREIVGEEVLAQDRLLLLRFRPHLAEVRHGSGDGTHKGCEGDEGEEQDADGIDTFHHVRRRNIHGRGSELSQRPVKGRRVLEHHVSIPDVGDREPRDGVDLAFLGADEVPPTSDVVVREHEAKDHQDNVANCA
mmetsp:Transcript_10117/g.28305  ORF Transcript_10117/g.28305 Transcript_10117/m.28305 type:complete len:205 (+) Transcript_10117:431-1045(+)